MEQQSSISVLNSQFQKPKQQDKDTPNGCFHSLRKGECTRKEKCTYSHDLSVIAATPHYEKLLYNSKYKTRGQDAQKGTYESVRRVLKHANLCAVMDPAMDRLLYDTFLATFPGDSLVKQVLKKGAYGSHNGAQGQSYPGTSPRMPPRYEVSQDMTAGKAVEKW